MAEWGERDAMKAIKETEVDFSKRVDESDEVEDLYYEEQFKLTERNE